MANGDACEPKLAGVNQPGKKIPWDACITVTASAIAQGDMNDVELELYWMVITYQMFLAVTI
jgi:hypothetical protein